MLDLLLGHVLALTCTEVRFRRHGWSSEGAHWISSSRELSLPALKCALGSTDGPLREHVGSPPWSCTSLTCTEVRVRRHGWSSEGACWISSLVMYLPLPALKCALGGTDGPLREHVGSPPWSCTCPYGPAPVSGHEGWGNMDILKGPREKNSKIIFFFFFHTFFLNVSMFACMRVFLCLILMSGCSSSSVSILTFLLQTGEV
jgi:hypothetical protein